MSDRSWDQLDKVLALADSDHEGEALGALRMARRILSRDGLSFTDLAIATRRGRFSLSRTAFSPAVVQLEAKIDQMNDELAAHVAQNENLSTQIEFWRGRATELEQKLAAQHVETLRWKEMARQTAERLWDLGQMAHAEALAGRDGAQDDSETEEAPISSLKAVG